MKKRIPSLLLATAMTSSLLAACSGTSQEPAAQPSGNTPSAPAPAGKTTVQFWHSLGGKNGDYINGLIQRFNESQDKVEVVGTFQGSYDETVTKLQQAVAAKTAPDITMLERAYVQMFAESEVLEDLTPYMAKSKLTVADFPEGLMGHSTFDKKLVSLPLNRSTPILHVNKTMLDEKGLAIPKTWDELKQVANALVIKENGEFKRYGYSMPYDTWYPIAMISEAKGKFFNDEGTSLGFQEEGIKTFKFLKELQGTGALYYPPAQDSGNIVNQMFTSGKIGMMFQSTGVIGSLKDNVKFDYVTAYMPMDQVYANPTGGANVAIMAGSQHKDAAWEFINWTMTDPKGGLKFILDSGYLPFTKKMTESQEMKDLWAKEPNRKVAYDQLQYAVDTNKHVAWPQVMQEFFKMIQAVMYDNKDIGASLDTFRKEAERIMKQ
ncbi:sn-glycerol 3-phosphate transport system substrate-binding protein [Paenibacillus sp. UNCCL117]|uniref:ABC transporter substrate-binding protein n=1 Tax=unclassified Paenibacillus TaxID=185978 RepID=UPI00088F3240|nr:MULTISPECIES: ABC transporter substrate-binding protein [unclassified Paenibacillus]SDE56375.1 carbohydrate ABC transporter substrate-binding protein, CUT1 family [Paenibacillus sp. cl123]SFW66190.1 sn-glycerol 3-phosphate transport system substrate-binding protein [Paenibacillus sp. UNCCL117]